jgi:hypothetical protein
VTQGASATRVRRRCRAATRFGVRRLAVSREAPTPARPAGSPCGGVLRDRTRASTGALPSSSGRLSVHRSDCRGLRERPFGSSARRPGRSRRGHLGVELQEQLALVRAVALGEELSAVETFAVRASGAAVRGVAGFARFRSAGVAPDPSSSDGAVSRSLSGCPSRRVSLYSLRTISADGQGEPPIGRRHRSEARSRGTRQRLRCCVPCRVCGGPSALPWRSVASA